MTDPTAETYTCSACGWSRIRLPWESRADVIRNHESAVVHRMALVSDRTSYICSRCKEDIGPLDDEGQAVRGPHLCADKRRTSQPHAS